MRFTSKREKLLLVGLLASAFLVLMVIPVPSGSMQLVSVDGLPVQTRTIGFESSSDFLYGGSNWWWEQLYWPLSNPNNKFTQEYSSATGVVAHGGSYMARLELLNPSGGANPSDPYRLEVLHNWDALSLRELQLSEWHYFPSEDFSVDGFVAFHRTLYERYWGTGGSPYYSYNGFHISLVIDGRSSRPTYGQPIYAVALNHGDVPEGSLSSQDLYPSDTKQHWDSGVNAFVWNNGYAELVPEFDQWVNVVSYVLRDVNNYNNGRIKLWIDGELVYDISNIRTVGITPSLLDGANGENFLSSGFSLYTNSGASPKHCFFDDVTYEWTDLTVTSPTPSPTTPPSGGGGASTSPTPNPSGSTPAPTNTSSSGEEEGRIPFISDILDVLAWVLRIIFGGVS